MRERGFGAAREVSVIMGGQLIDFGQIAECKKPVESQTVVAETTSPRRFRRIASRAVTAEELQKPWHPIAPEQRDPNDLTAPAEKARTKDLEFRDKVNQYGQSQKNFYKPNPKSQENANIVSELLPPAARPVKILHETSQAINELKTLRARKMAAYLVTIVLPSDGAFAIMTPQAMAAAAKLQAFPFRSVYVLDEADKAGVPPEFLSRVGSDVIVLKNRLPKREMGEEITDAGTWWSQYVNPESDAKRLQAQFNYVNGRYKALLEHHRAYERDGNTRGMRMMEKGMAAYKREMENLFNHWKAQRDKSA